MLQNDCLVAKIGVDTAENGPSEVDGSGRLQSNLLLSNAGQLKIADFGLARTLQPHAQRTYTNKVPSAIRAFPVNGWQKLGVLFLCLKTAFIIS